MAKVRKLDVQYYKQKCFSSDFSDVTIRIGDKMIPAHKIVLAKNEVLNEKLKNGNIRHLLNITDCDVKTFKSFMRYLYYGEVQENKKTLDLLALAHKYHDQELKLLCEPKVCQDINIGNSVDRFITAIKYDCNLLKEKSVDFIRRNYEAVEQTESFENLIFDREITTAALRNIIKYLSPGHNFHMFSFDEVKDYMLGFHEAKTFSFNVDGFEWLFEMPARLRQDDRILKFHFTNCSSTKTVDILVILISYSTSKDLKLLECFDETFKKHEKKKFATNLAIDSMDTLNFRNTFYKDNVMRVKVKVTIKEQD